MGHRFAAMLQQRSIIREGVLAYCRQDTWSMVQLLHRLRELAPAG